MAILFTGNQAVRTAVNSALQGKTRAGVSFLAKVVTATDPYGQYMVDQGGYAGNAEAYFSLYPGAAGKVHAAVYYHYQGTRETSSQVDVATAQGNAFHVLISWSNGIATIYVSGVAVSQLYAGDAIGPAQVTPGNSYPISIGLDTYGFTPPNMNYQMAVDRFAMWADYAPTAADAIALRDNTRTPQQISPGNVPVYLSLAGTPGKAVALGDPGLVDSSPMGLSIVTLAGTGSPVYTTPLVYTPPAVVSSASVAPSGRGIVAIIKDRSGNLANVKSINLPSLSVSDPSGNGLGAYPLVGVPSLVAGTNESYTISVTGNSGGFSLTRAASAVYVDASQGVASVTSQIASALATLYTIDVSPSNTRVQATDFTVTSSTAGQVTTYTATFTGNPVCWKSWGDLGFDGSTLGTSSTSVISPKDAGFAASGTGWVAVPAGNEGTLQYISGSGRGTASWTFNGLTPGNKLSIYLTWIAGGSNNKNCPVTVYDGNAATPAMTKVVDQTQSPDGPGSIKPANPFSPFSYVGTVTPASTSIRVVLDATNPSPAGSATMADSVAVVSFATNPSSLARAAAGAYPTFTSTAGQVSGVMIEAGRGGYNYTNPSVSVTGGLGAGASLTAVVSGGQVAGFNVASGGSGYELGSYTVNGVSRPLPAPYYGAGGPSGQPLGTNPPYLPFLYFPLPQAIASSDAVTLTLKDGAAFVANGAVAATSGMAVAKSQASLLPPLPAGNKTLAIGYNVNLPDISSPVSMYANCAKNISGVYPITPQGATASYDANGYPVVGGGSATQFTAALKLHTYNGLDARGFALTPLSGVWTIMWDGAGEDCSLAIGAAVTPGAYSTGAATNNYRTYEADVLTGVLNAAVVSMTITPGARNVRVYRPGIDTSNPPLFDPEFLRMIAGARCLRFMDANPTNDSSIHDYADYNATSAIGYSGLKNYYGAAVQSIGPAPRDAFYGTQANTVPILVTTTVPHNIKPGQNCGLSLPGQVGNRNGYGFYDIVTGSGAVTGTVYLGGVTFLARVLSPTQVAFVVGANGGTGDTLAATFSGADVANGAVGNGVEPGMPIADEIALCNAVGADMWFNVPHEASDDCITRAFTQIAQGLNSGLKCHCEYSNEHWNSGSASFQQCNWFVSNGALQGLTGTQYYTMRAAHAHSVARAAFVAANRPATDLVRVMGSWAGFPQQITAPIASYAQAHGIQFDELAVAPYYGNDVPFNGDEPALNGVFDALTDDQYMDVAQLTMPYGYIGYTFAASHRPCLDQAGFTNVKLVCYEGGAEGGFQGSYFPQAAMSVKLVHRSLMWSLHPAQYPIVLNFLQQLQDAGCTLFNHYTTSGVNDLAYGSCWVAFRRWNQSTGRGDGSDGQYDNRTNFDDQLNTVSVIGGAYKAWMSLCPPPHKPGPKMMPRTSGEGSVSAPFGGRMRGRASR